MTSLKTFQLYSAQTGDRFGRVQAETELGAVDIFARRLGFDDASKMWKAGRFEYMSATEVQS